MPRKKKETPPGMPGAKSLFRNKVRMPVSITLTRDHHRMVKQAARRTSLTRADVIGLLIELYADGVTKREVALVEARQQKSDPP